MTSAPAGDPAAPWRRRCAVIGWLTLLFTAAVAATAPAASAHNALISSNPVAGSVVPTAPTSIELVFDQDVKDFQPKVAITITGHDPVEMVPTVNGSTVTADLTRIDLPGRDSVEPVSWRIGYRVVSADGHPVSGLLDFSVGSGAAQPVAARTTAPGEASDQAEPTAVADAAISSTEPAGGPSAHSTWWIVGALAAAVAVAGVVWGLRRRTTSPHHITAADRKDQAGS